MQLTPLIAPGTGVMSKAKAEGTYADLLGAYPKTSWALAGPQSSGGLWSASSEFSDRHLE